MHSGVDTYGVQTIENPRQILRAGALSNAAGVSTDTLRHYEKLGLLKKPPRTPSGYRAYPPESLDRVLLIRNALACGFTLKELASILRVRDAGGAPCRRVASLAHEKVQQLTAQIAQLIRLRDALKRTAEEWERRLENTSPHDRANLLESLSSNLTEEPVNADGGEDENAGSRRVPRASRFGLRPKPDYVPHARARNVV
jgi:DNA-binding transcriptional MerR regulator